MTGPFHRVWFFVTPWLCSVGGGISRTIIVLFRFFPLFMSCDFTQ